MGHTASDFTLINSTPLDVDKLNQALSYLDQSSTARGLLDNLIATHTPIEFIHNGDNDYDGNVKWDPTAGLMTQNTADHGAETGAQSAAIGLIHEAAHAQDPNLINDYKTKDSQYGNAAERYAVNDENKVARDLGEPTRDNHNGDQVKEENSTEHTTKDANGNTVWVEKGRDGQTEHEGNFTPGQSTAPQPDQGGDTGYSGYTGDSGGSQWWGSSWGSGSTDCAGSGSCSSCACGSCGSGGSCGCASCGCASCGSCGSCGSCAGCSSCMC